MVSFLKNKQGVVTFIINLDILENPRFRTTFYYENDNEFLVITMSFAFTMEIWKIE